MQKVIIPALALLIGMALGALLMKSSDSKPKKLSEAKSPEEQLDIIESVASQLDLEFINENILSNFDKSATEATSKAFDSTVKKISTKFRQTLDFVQPEEKKPFDYNEHKIKINDARDLINYYFSRTDQTILTGGEEACGDLKGILTGWSFNAQIFDSLKTEYPDLGEINFYLARKNVGSVKNTLTLVAIPSDRDGNLLVQENYLYEYARPCPPRCQKAIIQVSNGTRQSPIPMNTCIKNPLNLIQ